MVVTFAKCSETHFCGQAVRFQRRDMPRAVNVSGSELQPLRALSPSPSPGASSGRDGQMGTFGLWLSTVSSCGHMTCGKGWSVFPFPSLLFFTSGSSPHPPGEAEAQGDLICLHIYVLPVHLFTEVR